MAGPIKISVLAEGSKAKRELNSVGDTASKMGRTLSKIAIGAGIAIATRKMYEFGRASVSAASDAQQSMGATETVFGKFSNRVVRTSDKAAERFGLSANTYRESANLIGSLFRNQGVETDRLAGKSKQMIKVGSDLAATFGGTTTEAVEALGSALKGEFDPLERYGVSIKQSTVNTEAQAIATKKYGKELTALSTTQQTTVKQQATSNLLLKQSARSAGAFGRETDTLANQSQKLGANFENLKAKVGTGLTPALTAGAKVINKEVLPPLISLADKYLPKAGKAFAKWANSIDFDSLASDAKGFVTGVKWDSLSDSLGDITVLAGKVGPAFADSASDGLTVFGTALGFAADHADLLAKYMPVLVAGLVAYKGAQLVNNTVGRNSIIGFGLQISTTLTMAKANRDLALSLREVNSASTGPVSAIGKVGGAAAGATGKVSKFGTAAKGAAGLAGIGAMVAGAKTSNKAVGTLVSTLGGAATGFAVGGPIGAAVGGLGGLFAGLASNTEDAGAAAEETKAQYDALKSTLDQTTGAVTAQSKAALYQSLLADGTLDTLKKQGISYREAIAGITGQGSALRDLNGVLLQQSTLQAQEVDRLRELKDQRTKDQALTQTGVTLSVKDAAALRERQRVYDDAIPKLEKNTADRRDAIKTTLDSIDSLRAARREILLEAKATADYSGKLRGLPKRAKTEIKAEGVLPTTKAVARLAERYNLTPKQIKTLIKATGIEGSVKDVRKVQTRLEAIKNTKPDLRTYNRDISKQMDVAGATAGRGAEEVGRKAKEGLKRGAKADLSGFKQGVKTGADQTKSTASTGGQGVGASLKSGVLAGVGGLGTALSNAVAGAVNQAIAAGRRAAGAHSPSRKMAKLGKDMGDGLVLGAKKTEPDAKKGGKSLAESLLGGVDDGLSGIQRSLEKVTDYVTREIDKRIKNDKKAAKVTKIRLAGLADEYALLTKNGKAQDRNTARLERQRDALKSLVSASKSYAAGIRTSIIETGNVTSLNSEEGDTTSGSIIEKLKQQLIRAERFASLIASLTKDRLNDTSLKQLLAAGVEGGLATAEALAAGGSAAIREINSLTSQLTASGTKLGNKTADTFYGAGISAAEGLVKGLERQSKALDKVADRLAERLVKALKKALKIKSPSQVFRDIGRLTGEGLKIGLEDTHVHRVGQTLAKDLTTGFGTPALAAYSSSTGGTVNATAAPVIQIYMHPTSRPEEVGREVQKSLDAYYAAGGRARA